MIPPRSRGRVPGGPVEPPGVWSSPYRDLDGTALSFVDPRHAARHEHCATLWDYLRRRTEIAQWIPNLGLGRDHEYRDTVLDLAAHFHGDGAAAAVEELTRRATAQATLLAEA